MMDADGRGFRHVRMADGEILEIDGRNPFAAGLDDVLGAVGDLHVAAGVDVSDVAGIEPAVLVELLRAGAAIIARAPRPGRAPSAGQRSCRPSGCALFSSSVIFISTPNGGWPCFCLTSQPGLAVQIAHIRGFRVHSVPSGDISVMPQAWMTSTP